MHGTRSGISLNVVVRKLNLIAFISFRTRFWTNTITNGYHLPVWIDDDDTGR